MRLMIKLQVSNQCADCNMLFGDILYSINILYVVQNNQKSA